MVVLESGGMHTSPGNQYLQPDYLSPLPTTLDAKKSPLALLAQTCSQIGADSPSKPLISPLDKISKKISSNSERGTVSPGNNNNANTNNYNVKTTEHHKESKVAFKPYENNIVSKKNEPPRPASKSGSVDSYEDRRSESRSSSRKSVSPQTQHHPSETKSSESRKSASPATSGSGASPIIRSGLEVLQGHHSKDLGLPGFKPPLGVNPLCCPPELDPTNPAFRPPFAGGPFSPHHAAMLAASGFSANPSPYLSYARVKTPAGGEALVPVCKDPYCTGCQLSLGHNPLAGPCPSGCTQCDHQKYNLAAAAALSMVSPPHPLAYQLGRPYVCSWIVGDNYCGKRFGTSDELLQHLRTHTSSAESSTLMNSMRYPPSPVSPLSAAAARYHPYSKPGLPPTSSPFSAFNPTLGPYYSPYALYGQRLGAAVHP
ncbi:unnamed protein product [Bemisia tabaci]|uniref:C2H2-type domain-containing protein n=1 Tax=Bemisia tabaci TaxID=7038 RepID=A0A9P0AB72_BEMTA|nr:unnamed protein product [Bemisia tabaci]